MSEAQEKNADLNINAGTRAQVRIRARLRRIFRQEQWIFNGKPADTSNLPNTL